MAKLKPFSYLIAFAFFVFSIGAGAVGLPDIPNSHQGKFLPAADSLGDALIDGKPHAMIRLRHEDVDDDIPAGSPIASADTADQRSLRVTGGWTTQRYYGFFLRGELEAGRPIGSDKALNLDDDFRVPPTPAVNRANEGHAIIPDNEFEEINEFF